MWTPSRALEAILERYDNEERDWVLRYRIFLQRWFPYRTAEVVGFGTPEEPELELGPWRWHSPDVLRRPDRREPGPESMEAEK